MIRPGIGKLAAIILSVSLFAGCTATFTYNHLDWLIPWYVNDYVDLSRDQRRLLKERLAPLLQWHREEELVRYIELLNRIESDLSGAVTADHVQAWIDEIILAVERVEEIMMSVALDFGETVSDAQMNEFIESLWEQQGEYEEEFLSRSDEEYVQDNFDNLADFLDRFVGRLSPGQEQQLREASGSLRRFDAVWLEERKKWLKNLEPLLQRESGWQEAVQKAHSRRKKSRTARYQEIVDYNLRIITHAVADVLRQLSNEQHDRAVHEIDDIRSKLHKLVDRSQSSSMNQKEFRAFYSMREEHQTVP